MRYKQWFFYGVYLILIGCREKEVLENQWDKKIAQYEETEVKDWVLPEEWETFSGYLSKEEELVSAKIAQKEL